MGTKQWIVVLSATSVLLGSTALLAVLPASASISDGIFSIRATSEGHTSTSGMVPPAPTLPEAPQESTISSTGHRILLAVNHPAPPANMVLGYSTSDAHSVTLGPPAGELHPFYLIQLDNGKTPVWRSVDPGEARELTFKVATKIANIGKPSGGKLAITSKGKDFITPAPEGSLATKLPAGEWVVLDRVGGKFWASLDLENWKEISVPDLKPTETPVVGSDFYLTADSIVLFNDQDGPLEVWDIKRN